MYPGVICSVVHAATRCAFAISTLLPGSNLKNLAYEEGKKRGSLHQWKQAPFRCCELISFEACKPRRFPWEKRNLQLVERKRKTISGCLDIGFLARPIPKKEFCSQRRIDAEQIFALARRKVPHENRLKVRQVSNEFKIDAQITIPRDREDGVVFGMRQI